MGQWRIFLRSLFAKRVLPGPYQGATECLSTALVPAGGAFCCFVLPVQCPQLDNVTCAGRQPWQAMGHQAPCLGSNSEEWIFVALDFLQIDADSKLKNS
jgi:hypothetical protein